MISRVLFDTNVLASGFASPSGPPGQLLMRMAKGEFVLLVSDVVVEELSRTFRNEYFRQIVDPHVVTENLSFLRRETEWVEITAQVLGVASHPEDDLILATAVSGKADYLVTGDRDLLALGAVQETIILAPRAFLDLLDEDDSF